MRSVPMKNLKKFTTVLLCIVLAAAIFSACGNADTDTKENCDLVIKGRHDPCIVQRAIPVVEAAAAWAILDVCLSEKGRCW